MGVFIPQRYPVLVLLTLQLGVIEVSAFNPDSYKPYQWDWKFQTKNFDKVPRVPCPDGALRRCVCKNDVTKSLYMVDCGEGTIQISDIHHLQHNATHFRSTNYYNNILTLSNGSFDRSTQLIHLDLSANWLETIESDAFVGLTKLVILDLSGNNLFTPGEFLRPLSSLQTLNFRQYPDFHAPSLKSCETIENIMKGISDLKQLEKLQISCPQIRKDDVLLLQHTSVTYLSIYNLRNGIERGAFSNWSALNSLQLNALAASVFPKLSDIQVEQLYIKGGLEGETNFTGFHAPHLKALTIYNTDLEYIDFGSLGIHTLQWLDLSFNKITSLDLSFGFHSLQGLDISHNRISSLDLPFRAHALQWLNFSYNGISSFDMSEMEQLHSIDISHQKSCFSFNKTLPDSLTFVNFSGTQLCSELSICLFNAQFVNRQRTLLTGFFYSQFFDPVKPRLLKDIYDLWNLLLRVSWKKHSAADDVNVHKIEDFIVESKCENITPKVPFRHLNLQDNDIECVYSSLFNQYDWSALNILNLSNNRLGFGTCADASTSHFMDFLRPLPNLTDLYLDGNPIK